ncbi:MAG: glycosyltransferase family 4 protein [Chloroflexi bacterium]|nr:glycosyltransferase family 4 protein [Chloroflexota bacterium]
MKVCFLLHQGSMYSGGQGIYLHHLTRELVELGNEVHVICGPPYPELADGIVLHRVQSYSVYRLLETGRFFFYGRDPRSFFHPLNFYELATSRFGMFSAMAAFSVRAYGKLRELAETHRFDLIHDVQVLGYGALLIKASGLPIVANIHHPLQIDRANSVRQAGSLAEKLRWMRFYPFFMQEIVARRVDRIITGSRDSAALVEREFSLPAERVAVVYDGVDTETFRPLKLRRRPNSLLFVGNSDDRNKGVRYLLEALALLKGRRDVRLTVVDRPEASLVPELAGELGIGDRVKLTGRVSREELVRLYNTTQLLVSPSLYEGFGLPAAEAMACGTPVVATTAGAFPEVIEQGVSGLLAPPADAPALAKTIERVLDDSRLRRRLREAGRQRIVDHFSWRETAQRTLAVYRDVLSVRDGR